MHRSLLAPPLRAFLQAFVLWVSGPGLAAAETLALPATRDNTIFDASPPTLSNGAGAYMFVGLNANGQPRRALVRFDLSALPAGSRVQAARLQLFMSQTTDANGVLVHLRALSADWGEGSSNSGGTPVGGGGGGAPATATDATWVHRFYDNATWATPGGDFASSDSATQLIGANGLYTFDDPRIAADVQRWLSNPSSNFGWVLYGDSGAPRTAKRFNARENTDAPSRPQLIVDYSPASTPVPLPLWSVGAAAFGLVVSALSVRRRRALR